MIDTLIINNNPKISEKLEKIVQWEKLGFSVTMTTTKQIEDTLIESADFILAEIDVDNSKMLEKTRKVNENAIIVTLANEEDIEFAQRALQFNVSGYLLTKKLNVMSITETLSRVKKIYKKRFDERKNFLKYYGEVQENRNLFKEKIIKDILCGNEVSEVYLEEKSEIYNFVIPKKNINFIALFIDDIQEQLENGLIKKQSLLMFSIINIIEEIFAVTVFTYNNSFIIPVDEKKFDINDLTMKANLTKNTILVFLKVNVSICIDTKAVKFLDLKKTYVRLEKLRDNYFYMPTGQVTSTNDKMNFLPMRNSYNAYLETFKIRIEKHHSFLKVFEKCMKEIKKKNYEPSTVKKLMIELQKYLEERISRIGLTYVYNNFYYDNYDMCVKNINRIFKCYYNSFEILDKVDNNNDVIEVIKYINENIENDISLESAAKHIYKNPSYLSRLFKKHTGKTFTRYLIEGRIKRATYLLEETSLSISYICSQIGIENSHYFYKFYKRETGKCPGEVRK